MPADQAAGLRRRSMQQPVHCIHCFFDTGESSTQLVQALHQRGQVSLLVDMRGRLFIDPSTRNLFEWKQQLARGQLHTLPQTYGAGWYAPGVRADEPSFHCVEQGYDHLVFDAGPIGTGVALRPNTLNTVFIEIHPTDHSMQRAYSLLKTLAWAGDTLSIGLLGDAAACDHVLTAYSHFLEQPSTQVIYSAAHEDDGFAALAIRMEDEEALRVTRCITGTNPNHGR